MTFRNQKVQFPHLTDEQINLLHNKFIQDIYSVRPCTRYVGYRDE